MRSMSHATARLLAVSAFVVIGPACTLILGDFERGGGTSTGGGAGGASTTSSAGAGGGGGTAPACTGGTACTGPSECPAPSTECVLRTCDIGCCGTSNVADGTVVAAGQTDKNCRKWVCDGNGGLEEVDDDTDVPDPLDDCHIGVCMIGVPTQDVQVAGTMCASNGGAVCDGNGACVECNADTNCTAPDTCDKGAGKCVPPGCANNMQDGQETDSDCGGPLCAPCGIGKSCLLGSDCTSLVCDPALHVCLVPTCTDNVKNGSETGKDCGGVSCGPCPAGEGCATGADCVSKSCDASLVCAAATCTDGAQNGQETGKDCGGPDCNPCGDGQPCGADIDCASLVCKSGSCQAPTCADTKKNGSETGADCGGPMCGPCPGGEGCALAGDCQSIVCANGVCATPSCNDGVKNQGETDADCGGPSCAPCYFGKGCTANADCKSELCTNGLCDVKPFVTGQGGPWGITNDATNVYWTNSGDGSIGTAALGVPGSFTYVVPPGSCGGGGGAGHIVRDTTTNVHWNRQSNAIFSSPIMGGACNKLTTSGAGATSLASDGASIYFPSAGSAAIARVSTTGGGQTNLYFSNGIYPDSAIFYLAPSTLLWTESGAVWQGKTGGGNPPPVQIAVSQNNPVDVVADANAVYWLDRGAFSSTAGGTVNMLANGSTQPVVLASGLGQPRFMALDAGFVYWTESTSGVVAKVPIGGGTVTVIAGGQQQPMGITITGTHVFWADSLAGTVTRSLK